MNRKNQLLTIGLLLCHSLVLAQSANKVGAFEESFENINNLQSEGWIFDNRSDFITKLDWFQGVASDFPAHSGPTNSYIANTTATGVNTICNWLIMPDIGFVEQLSFFTRALGDVNEVTRLLVMHSPNGSTNTGNCQSAPTQKGTEDFGDFQTLLEINSMLNPESYPLDWSQYHIDINSTGRIAFLFYVTEVGQAPFNTGLVAIDTVTVGSGVPPINSTQIIPSLSVYGILIMIFIFMGVLFMNKKNLTRKYK